jgi:two-component system response regulator QseB
MRVLLIEDDPMIGRAVAAGLQDAGYTVDWVRDGADAELALGHQLYELALLDLGLPRRDGLDILKGLRRSGSRLPVVIITARDAVADRVAGLDSGADDEALMKEPGAVVSREKLEDAVYGWGEEVGSNSIEVHLHHLRRKLRPELIRNVRGVGYRIAVLQ